MFIKSLNLSGKSPHNEKQQQLGNDVPDETETPQEKRKTKTRVGHETEPVAKAGERVRKKKNSAKAERERVIDSGEREVDKEIKNQLLRLSVKPYKRLLVSMDDEAVWYEQVS